METPTRVFSQKTPLVRETNFNHHRPLNQQTPQKHPFLPVSHRVARLHPVETQTGFFELTSRNIAKELCNVLGGKQWLSNSEGRRYRLNLPREAMMVLPDITEWPTSIADEHTKHILLRNYGRRTLLCRIVGWCDRNTTLIAVISLVATLIALAVTVLFGI